MLTGQEALDGKISEAAQADWAVGSGGKTQRWVELTGQEVLAGKTTEVACADKAGGAGQENPWAGLHYMWSRGWAGNPSSGSR